MSLPVTFICQLKITATMRSCVCFDQMHVEHMQIGRYCCNKVAMSNKGGIVVNRYFFSERNYFLKIFTLQTFLLNRFQSLISAKQPKPCTPFGAYRAGPRTPLLQSSEIPNSALTVQIGNFQLTTCLKIDLNQPIELQLTVRRFQSSLHVQRP